MESLWYWFFTLSSFHSKKNTYQKKYWRDTSVCYKTKTFMQFSWKVAGFQPICDNFATKNPNITKSKLPPRLGQCEGHLYWLYDYSDSQVEDSLKMLEAYWRYETYSFSKDIDTYNKPICTLCIKRYNWCRQFYVDILPLAFIAVKPSHRKLPNACLE